MSSDSAAVFIARSYFSGIDSLFAVIVFRLPCASAHCSVELERIVSLLKWRAFPAHVF